MHLMNSLFSRAHELKKAEFLYTSDLSIFSSEEVLNKWRNVIS